MPLLVKVRELQGQSLALLEHKTGTGQVMALLGQMALLAKTTALVG